MVSLICTTCKGLEVLNIKIAPKAKANEFGIENMKLLKAIKHSTSLTELIVPIGNLTPQVLDTLGEIFFLNAYLRKVELLVTS